MLALIEPTPVYVFLKGLVHVCYFGLVVSVAFVDPNISLTKRGTSRAPGQEYALATVRIYHLLQRNIVMIQHYAKISIAFVFGMRVNQIKVAAPEVFCNLCLLDCQRRKVSAPVKVFYTAACCDRLYTESLVIKIKNELVVLVPNRWLVYTVYHGQRSCAKLGRQQLMEIGYAHKVWRKGTIGYVVVIVAMYVQHAQ